VAAAKQIPLASRNFLRSNKNFAAAPLSFVNTRAADQIQTDSEEEIQPQTPKTPATVMSNAQLTTQSPALLKQLEKLRNVKGPKRRPPSIRARPSLRTTPMSATRGSTVTPKKSTAPAEKSTQAKMTKANRQKGMTKANRQKGMLSPRRRNLTSPIKQTRSSRVTPGASGTPRTTPRGLTVRRYQSTPTPRGHQTRKQQDLGQIR